MNSKKAIVVIGTGRSGTSLFAGMLHYLGVDMGKDFISADFNNLTGHWEDKEFAGLNRMAVKKEISEEDWVKVTEDLLTERSNSLKTARWGWKIPITTNLIGWYKKHGFLDKMELIWIDRKQEDCIESCMRCYGHTKEQATKLITKRYAILVEAEKQGLIKMRIKFDGLISEPKTIIDKVNEEFNLNATDEQKQMALEMVNQNDKEKSVMVGMPTMGSIHTHLISKIIRWCKDGAGLYATHKVAPVDHARNEIVREFLKTNMDYLFFVDSDTIPPDWALKAMLKSNKDIVTGLTPMLRYDDHQDTWATMYNAFNRERDENGKVIKTRVAEGNGLVEVERCGASCLLIKREVLEKMEEPWFKFDWDEKHREHTSEDIYFCDQARALGYKIYANMEVVCKHNKNVLL